MTEHHLPQSVGAYLRGLREAKRGSLADMARATRVSESQLAAIESDRFSELPAPVFVKGFIRAYCHFLGEPADEALGRYRDLLGERVIPAAPVPARRGMPVMPAWLGSPVFISFALLVVFGAGLLAVNGGIKQRPRVSAERAVPVPAERRPAAPNTVAVAPPVAPAAPDGPGPQRLLVRAIEPTWIRIQTDDLRAVQELLPPGATREWTAETAVRADRGKRRRDRGRAEWPADASPGPIGRGDPAAGACRKRRPPDRRACSGLSPTGSAAGCRRTRDRLDDGLDALLAVGRPVDDALLDELEETLIAADLGAATASLFVKRLRDEIKRGRAVQSVDVRALLGRFLEETLADAAAPLNLESRPSVIFMLGVNGAGKTTSAGKLAAMLKADGKSVMLAAADTFRAAAIEQLEEWGRRAGVEVIRQAAGADPSAVVFDAVKAAHARSWTCCWSTRAGRLHAKSNLMDELIKLKKVVTRQLPGAPHETLVW